MRLDEVRRGSGGDPEQLVFLKKKTKHYYKLRKALRKVLSEITYLVGSIDLENNILFQFLGCN